jgi:hypothetical protein
VWFSVDACNKAVQGRSTLLRNLLQRIPELRLKAHTGVVASNCDRVLPRYRRFGWLWRFHLACPLRLKAISTRLDEPTEQVPSRPLVPPPNLELLYRLPNRLRLVGRFDVADEFSGRAPDAGYAPAMEFGLGHGPSSPPERLLLFVRTKRRCRSLEGDCDGIDDEMRALRHIPQPFILLGALDWADAEPNPALTVPALPYLVPSVLQ